jgi:hypothetical protein
MLFLLGICGVVFSFMLANASFNRKTIAGEVIGFIIIGSILAFVLFLMLTGGAG